MKIAYDADGSLIYATKGQELDVKAVYYCPKFILHHHVQMKSDLRSDETLRKSCHFFF